MKLVGPVPHPQGDGARAMRYFADLRANRKLSLAISHRERDPQRRHDALKRLGLVDELKELGHGERESTSEPFDVHECNVSAASFDIG